MPAAIRPCPRCGNPMQTGAVHLEPTGFRFLLTGFSWSRLDFLRRGEARSKSSIVMDQGDSRAAFRCEDCQIVTIYPLFHDQKVPDGW